jgi:hypothetical protein
MPLKEPVFEMLAEKRPMSEMGRPALRAFSSPTMT